MTSPATGQPARTPTSLRPGLREAANALRIATVGHGSAPPRVVSHPTRRSEVDHAAGTDEEARDDQARDDEARDDEASAIAELGQLLDVLSDTVADLAAASRSPRRASLRRLEATLADAGTHATDLLEPTDLSLPTARDPRP